MRRASTVSRYELAWAIPGVAILVGMFGALMFAAFSAGIHLPGDAGRVDPTKLATTAPFDKPGIVQVGPGHYEVRLVAQIWSFAPNEIRVPVGSTVTFITTSRDVVHGLYIPKSIVNLMLLPGQVTRFSARFDRPGEYPLLCHEYCGILHHTMAGKLIVESRS